PQTDLIRLEALLAEARITQGRTRDLLDGACRQLAAEIGVPELPTGLPPGTLPSRPPRWQAEGILHRTLEVSTALKQAKVEAGRARLAVDRAKAAVTPNVTVGAGATIDNTDQTAGGQFSVETVLPVWDRQQGNIHEAQAKLAGALAAVRSVETRLQR